MEFSRLIYVVLLLLAALMLSGCGWRVVSAATNITSMGRFTLNVYVTTAPKPEEESIEIIMYRVHVAKRELKRLKFLRRQQELAAYYNVGTN